MKLARNSALSLIGLTIIVQGVLAMDNGKPVFSSAEDVVFEDIIPGVVAFGTVAGNRVNSSHGTFVRIPPGMATPPHTHSAEYHAVIIQGRMENPIADVYKSEVTLTAGSYYFVPANAEHITRCAADSPVSCISFFYQSVPFDFTVAK